MIEGFTLILGSQGERHVIVWYPNDGGWLGYSICGKVSSQSISEGVWQKFPRIMYRSQQEVYDFLTRDSASCSACEERLADPTNHPYVVRNHNREKVPPVVVDVQQPTMTTFKDIMSVAVADLQQSTSEEFDAVTSELREICRYLKGIGDDLKSVRIASILQYADLGTLKVGEAREQVNYLMEHQHRTDLYEYK